MNIPVGTKILLDFPASTSRMPATLVGYERGSYLVLRVPLAPGIRDRVVEGNTITVRLVVDGTVLGFRERITGFIVHPYPLVFVSYPRDFESLPLRKRPRVACFFPAQATIRGATFDGLLLDISDSGCKFSFNYAARSEIITIKPEDPVTLRFHALDSTRVIEIEGKVANSRRQDHKVDVGIAWSLSGSQYEDIISRYVERVNRALEND